MPQLHSGLIGGSKYQITNSVRLRASASAYFSRTFGAPTLNTKFYLAVRLKRGTLGSAQTIISSYNGSATDLAQIYFDATDHLVMSSASSSVTGANATTSAVFRDPSAWLMLEFLWDGTLGTVADRAQIWVNGVRQSVTGSNGAATIWHGNTAVANRIGVTPAGSNQSDFYLADVFCVDGQSLTLPLCGQTNSDGVWVPKAYTGTYGNNGFHLDFKDANLTAGSNVGLGKDVSGNGNYWNTNNISVTAGVTYDSMVDTPTNNYATLNPIVASAANISYAALRSGTTAVQGTMEAAVFAGAYWEVTAAGSAVTAGVISGTGTTNTTTVTANKVFGFRLTGAGALDYINITDVGSWTGITTGLTAQQFPYGITQAADWNFGQRPFIGTASGKALCTANLPAVAIPQPSKHHDVKTHAGSASTQSITGVGFQPDLVWVKDRGNAQDHKLTDSVRGTTKALISDTTGAETTDANGVTAFNSNGFSLGTGTRSYSDSNTDAYVDWLWKAGGNSNTFNKDGVGYASMAAAGLTDGSIAATGISVNTTAGFSIVTYTGTGANGTVGHGLGVAPKMLITKSRNDATYGWGTWHASISNTEIIFLNTTAAKASAVNAWNSTSPTTIVFSLGTDQYANFNAKTFVAYCFAEIPGYSKFGSYVGNGSADGPFVYCGFKPKYLLTKNASTAGTNWVLHDATREPYNEMGTNSVGYALNPENSAAESTNAGLWATDFTATGFKIRSTSSSHNGSTATIIYAAFAEFPFGGSNVSPSPAR